MERATLENITTRRAAMPLFRTSSFRFDPDQEGQGGKGEDTVPKSEAEKAFKARDAAKQERAALESVLAELGVDDVTIERGEDGKPKVASKSLAELRKLVDAARDGRRKNQRDANDFETREKDLNAAHQKQLQDFRAKAQKETDALNRWIAGQSVFGPIREACQAEGAIDDDNGRFGDIVALLSPRIKCKPVFNEDAGEVKVEVEVLGEDGAPMLDSSAKPVTIRQLVADFLEKRPKYRGQRAKPGPGVGGHGQRPAGGSVAGGSANPQADAARRFFGIKAKS